MNNKFIFKLSFNIPNRSGYVDKLFYVPSTRNDVLTMDHSQKCVGILIPYTALMHVWICLVASNFTRSIYNKRLFKSSAQ